jgi:hypothetical protein
MPATSNATRRDASASKMAELFRSGDYALATIVEAMAARMHENGPAKG